MLLSDQCNFFMLDERMARGDEGPDRYSEEVREAEQAWAHELQLERQQMALDALYRCQTAGANAEDLETLARELGLSQMWASWKLKDKDE